MSVIVAGFVAAAAVGNKIRHANTHSQEFPKSNSNRASNKRIIYLLLYKCGRERGVRCEVSDKSRFHFLRGHFLCSASASQI